VLPLVVLPAEAAAVAAEDEAVELPLEDGSLLYEYMSLRAASLSWRLMAR
jgi:3-methyladenine DNA glycosylase Tag